MDMVSRVVEIFVHGTRSSRPEDLEPTPMVPVRQVEAVANRGLKEDSRYFRSVPQGTERKRQVSLIDEATIWRLERQFGPIPRDIIKSQIVIEGDLFLPALLGKTLIFDGGAEIVLSIPRNPCFAMDLIKPGVKDAMGDGQQGALGMVLASGTITVGSGIVVADTAQAEPELARI